MKKILILTVFAVMSVFATYAQKTVAVYVTGDQDDGVKKVLGSKMVTYITQSDDFSAVERTADFLSALNAEHDYQVSGEVTNSQIVKLGQQFGARYVAVVDVNEVYGDLFISSRLIDVQTSKIDSSYDASGSGGSLQALTELANKIADGLILGPARIIEAKKKEAEQRKQAERQEKENQLRAQAIRNLTPNGAIECGHYIILNQAIPVKVTYDATSQNFSIYAREQLPDGFQLAHSGVFEYLLRNYCQPWNFNRDIDGLLSGKRWVFDASLPLKSRRNAGKKDETIQFYVKSYYSGSGASFNDIIGILSKTKNGWDAITKSDVNCYYLAYRYPLTENEIQAEMRRISR